MRPNASSSEAAQARSFFSLSNGTWASDKYSANLDADSCSDAHASRARKARPDVSGLRVPRLNHAGTFARRSACSISPT